MNESRQATPTRTVPVPEADSAAADTSAAPSRQDAWRTVALVAAALVFVAIALALVYGLATHPPLTAVLADISIIVLALVTMVTCIFLAILLVQLQSLIVLLRDEVQPILKSINDTAGTVRGTTTFVSDSVVKPMITVSSYISGVTATLRTLMGGSVRAKNQVRRPGPASSGGDSSSGESLQS